MAFETNPLQNCEGLLICIAKWVNEINYGLFWTMFLLTFMIILFMATIRYGTPRAASYAGISGIFLSIWFFTAELMPFNVALWFWIFGAGSIALVILGNRG